MRTQLCDTLGIEYPIIQAGMGAFTSPDLVAAVSNAGGLGSVGTAMRSADDLRQIIADLRGRSDRPFAVNFLVSDLVEEAFGAVLDERVPIISFALGAPGDFVHRAHDSGALVMHQIHTVRQAEEAAEQGVDIIIAQGGEAGGFGQFVSEMALIPQVVDAVSPLPVVAAGGIADGRGIAAALLMGAVGVNLGTRFLASVEAPISLEWKQAIVDAESEDTVKAEFWNTMMPTPGRAGYGTVPRTLRTPFTDRMLANPSEAAEQAEELRDEIIEALEGDRLHEYVAFAGQTAGLIKEILPVAEIIRRLVIETEQTLKRASTVLAQPA